MTLPKLPLHKELFNIAVGTSDKCRLLVGADAESVISPLAIAALQLQAAQVGCSSGSNGFVGLLLARIGGTAYSHVRGWLTDNTDSQDGKVISEHPRKENH